VIDIKRKNPPIIVFVDGITIPSNGSYPGIEISGQMAYLNKKCGSK